MNFRLILLVIVLLLCSCGGGTSGTSSTSGGDLDVRTIRGTIVEVSGEPVAGATVRVQGGLDSSITDAQGQFELNDATGGALILEIEDQGAVIDFEVEDVSADSRVINVDAQIDRTTNSASALSLNGSVRVIGSCETFSESRGSSVQITVPEGIRSCDFDYAFASGAQLVLDSLEIESTSCSGLSASVNGMQETGSVLHVYQAMQISKISRTCEARVRASFQGFKTAAYFSIRYITGKGSSSGIQGNYRGSLSLVRGSSPASDCSRFLDNRVQLAVSVSSDTIKASLPKEGLELSKAVSERGDLVKVLQSDGSVFEEVRVRSMGGLGTSRANFTVYYFVGTGAGNGPSCVRLYSGQLDKVK